MIKKSMGFKEKGIHPAGWSAWWREEVPVNYWYAWLVFLFLNWVNWRCWNELEGLTNAQRKWVIVLGMLNSLFFTLLLAAIDAFLKRQNAGKPGRWLFSALLSILVASFAFDALVFQRLGMHLGTCLRLLAENGLDHFFVTVEATGLRLPAMMGIGGVILAAGAVGAWLNKTTWLLSNTRCLAVRMPVIVVAIAILGAGLLGMDVLSHWSNQLSRIRSEQRRVLPGTVAFGTVAHSIKLADAGLPALPPPGQIVNDVHPVAAGQKPLPDIFVFVVESLRADYVDRSTSPQLNEFRKDCLPFGDSLASGNATHISWFSLLRSEFPLYFGMVRRSPERWGSLPLTLLKNMGYEIHVLAGAFLNYQNSDQIAFGPDLALVNTIVDGRSMPHLSRPVRDQRIAGLLAKKMRERKGGRLFLVFFESTHHDYYWPDDYPAPFNPVADTWNYFLNFDISQDELTGIKNRYRNSIHYVDSLAGQILNQLKVEDRYKDALILVTGDHGEEFLEHGKLVHASEVCRVQTAVPFLMKLPAGISIPDTNRFARIRATHVDFFPTVLDILGGDSISGCHGESLFKKNDDFALVADDNGNRDPFQFCIYGGGYKAWLQFRNSETRIALEKSILVQKITHSDDQLLDISNEDRLREILRNQLKPGLRKVFPQIQL